jgi:serine/threonine protein kinase
MSISTDPRIGSELFGYRLEALLGRGGMGIVYKAYDPRLKRYVALKLIAPGLSEDERFRDRFLAETELAASLEHPNVVPIHDAGEVDGQLYLAMRYVEGGELKTLLEKTGALEPARAVTICGQIAAALDAAHARGLVHRDVKPSNVLLDENEHVYLADFGLSRRLADPGGHGEGGFSVGTPAYAAPEQIEGGEVDGRADVYSLGCLMYECLTGQPPFVRDSELAVLWAHVQEEPPAASEHNPDLPIDIDPVLAKAMAKSPDDRYGSCGELVATARDALGLQELVVGRKGRLLALAAGAALIAAAILAVVLLSQGKGGPPGRPSAKPTLTPKADSLQRIDPRTNKLVATIRVGAGANGVATGDGAVFVASTDTQTVSRVDPKSNAIVKTISASGAPRSIALGRTPDGPVLWVVSNNSFGPCALSQLDPETLLTNYTLNPTGKDNACGPVATLNGTTWFGGSSQFLALVDPYTGEAIRTIATGQISDPEAHGLAMGDDAVWLASPYTEELYRFDRRGRRAIAIGPGSFPSDVAVGEGGVWVADSMHDTIVEIDPSRNRIVRRVRVGREPIAVVVGSGAVWVADDGGGTVSRIDPSTGRVTTFRVGQHPRNIAVGEGAVWVTVHPS